MFYLPYTSLLPSPFWRVLCDDCNRKNLEKNGKFMGIKLSWSFYKFKFEKKLLISIHQVVQPEKKYRRGFLCSKNLEFQKLFSKKNFCENFAYTAWETNTSYLFSFTWFVNNYRKKIYNWISDFCKCIRLKLCQLVCLAIKQFNIMLDWIPENCKNKNKIELGELDSPGKILMTESCTTIHD